MDGATNLAAPLDEQAGNDREKRGRSLRDHIPAVVRTAKRVRRGELYRAHAFTVRECLTQRWQRKGSSFLNASSAAQLAAPDGGVSAAARARALLMC
jgi:hypothetical protein